MEQADLFFDYLNSKHGSIKFTMEKEDNHKLPFLDVYIDNSGNNFNTSIYRKSTFSGLLMNYFSFQPMTYKVALVRCLIDRVFRINNTWLGFDANLKQLFHILKRNCYPEYILNKITKSYLNSKYVSNDNNIVSETAKVMYVKLPYVGRGLLL